MILSFPVLLIKDSNRNYTGIFSPDLQKYFQFDESELTDFELIHQATNMLKKYLDEQLLQGNKIDLPKKLKHYRERSIGENNIWTKIYVDIDRKPGMAETSFYWGGVLSNFLSTVSWAFMAILAMEVTSTVGGKRLGIVTASVSIPISMIAYVFSGTAGALAAVGAGIDKIYRKKSPHEKNYFSNFEKDLIRTFTDNGEASRIPPTCKSTTALIIGALGLGGSLLINTTAFNYTTFVDLNLLNQRAQEKGTVFPSDFVKASIFVLVTTTFLAKITFDGNFVIKCLDGFNTWLHNAKDKHSDNHNHLADSDGILLLESNKYSSVSTSSLSVSM